MLLPKGGATPLAAPAGNVVWPLAKPAEVVVLPVAAPTAAKTTISAAAPTPKISVATTSTTFTAPVATTSTTFTAPVATKNSTVTISGISTFLQQAFDTLNLYRTDPAAALADVQAEKLLFNNEGYIVYPEEMWRPSFEGTKVYDDAIESLKKQQPVGALKWSDDLAKCAEFHNADIGPLGLMTHASSDGSDSF